MYLKKKFECEFVFVFRSPACMEALFNNAIAGKYSITVSWVEPHPPLPVATCSCTVCMYVLCVFLHNDIPAVI